MKLFASFILIIILSATASISFAQGKKALKQQPKAATQAQAEKPQVVQIFYHVAKGAHLESQDAKNVSFTLKPTRAFITIEF
jgi:hypothetical protein